ncbi:hypothetical protein [Thiocapsa bogorovii]|nr:hypothetical protein [Thiocapsa bogorovii]
MDVWIDGFLRRKESPAEHIGGLFPDHHTLLAALSPGLKTILG